jgi:hypothetical protein
MPEDADKIGATGEYERGDTVEHRSITLQATIRDSFRQNRFPRSPSSSSLCDAQFDGPEIRLNPARELAIVA